MTPDTSSRRSGPRPLVNAVSDYVELRETFIVGRQTGIINP